MIKTIYQKNSHNFSNLLKDLITYTKKTPLLVTGPSGVGKSTFVDKLIFESLPGKFRQTVNYTSRNPRPNEKHGIDYYFVSNQEFENRIKSNNFIEYQNHYNTYYGSCKEEVLKIIRNEKKIPVFVIDIKGAQKIINEIDDINRIFIQPEGIDQLQQRLESRGTESDEKIKQRVDKAYEELEMSKFMYNKDQIVINGQFDQSYQYFLQKVINLYDFHHEKQGIEAQIKYTSSNDKINYNQFIHN